MYLGIDWGEKNIGLATANKKDKIATPLKTIENNEERIDKIKKLCQKKSIKTIVLGLPKSFDGKKHETAQKVENFAKKLKAKIEIPIKFENEVFSSKIAKRFSKESLDKRAASLILQSHLDKLNQ